MAKSEEKNTDKNKDFIEIPIGKHFSKIRENPWIIATFVLGLLFLGALIFGVRGSGGLKIASEADVGSKIVDFLNSQVQTGGVELQSVNWNSGGYYDVIVEYQGNQIPFSVTADGKNIITDLVSVNGGSALNNNQGNTGNTKIPSIDIPADAPVLGDINAEVTIVEFSDYQCPFCRKFYTETLGQIKQTYIDTGKAKLVFMDFPLNFHPSAVPAAQAARCAREIAGDAAYWKMHDKMFDEENILDGGTVQSTVTFTADDIKRWANEIGYDIGACLDSNKYADEVNSNLDYGTTLGVSGTPGFFVGNSETGFTAIEGAVPYSTFQQAIDSALAGN